MITYIYNLRLGNPKVRFVDPRQVYLYHAQILFETEGTSILTPPERPVQFSALTSFQISDFMEAVLGDLPDRLLERS